MNRKPRPEGEDVRLNLAAEIADAMGCAIAQALPLADPRSAADHEATAQPPFDDEPDYGSLTD